MGVIGRLIGRALVLGLAVLALTLAAVLFTTHQYRAAHMMGAGLDAPVEAIIVLGGGVEGDGRLDFGSRRRVEGAVRLLEAGRAETLIFSGGLGKYHPTTPAASLMRDFAARLGAPRDRLLIEPRAISTFENLRFAFDMAETRRLGALALLSDGYHLPRAAALARYWGRPDIALIAVPGAETQWWPIRAVHLTREALAWWLNLGKVVAWEALGLIGMDEAERADLIR